MDNTERLALRHKRNAASPPFLRGGFRPFFLLGPCWAIGALLIWIWSLAGGPAQIGQLDALAWHRHEMLFGFIGAIVAGFILTAIPNWTGRLPVAGMPLAALVVWWMLGRAIHFIPLSCSPVQDLSAKNSFLPSLAEIDRSGLELGRVGGTTSKRRLIML